MSLDVSFVVIGLGDWGTEVAEALERLPGAALRALCDANVDVVRRLRERFPEARVIGSVDEVLCAADLEAVVVGIPLPARRAVTRLALASGRHVFVRAPPASTGEGIDRLAALATRSRRRLVVGDQGLEHAALRRLVVTAESGDLGDVQFIQAESQHPGPRPAGDALRTLGLEQLTTVLALAREQPVGISAYGHATAEQDTLDVVGCHLRFPSGIAADLRLSRIGHREVRQVTIVGSERSATYDALERTVTIYEWPGAGTSTADDTGYPDAGTALTLRFAETPPLDRELGAFVAAVRGDCDALGDVRGMAQSRGVVDAVRRLLDEPSKKIGDARRVSVPPSPTGAGGLGPGSLAMEHGWWSPPDLGAV